MTFLICGLGSIGRRHLRILRESGNYKFIAFRSGKSSSGREEGITEEIFDLKELKKYEISGALITNPTSLHIPTAIEIAKKGIPLFIEKPLSGNLKGITKIQSLIQKKKIPVLIGYNMIYHPGILCLKKLIKEKKIGKIISAKSQFGTYMPGWHKNEDYKKSYAALPALGGGVVLTSIHEQNYLTDFFGEVMQVKAMETGGDNIGIKAEEGAEILMKHSGGVVTNIHLNFFQKPYYRTCEVIGTEGTLYWDFRIPEVKVLFDGKTEIIKLGKNWKELLDASYENQMKHFVNVVRKIEEPRMNLQNGINDLKTAIKILKNIGRSHN